MTIDFDDSVEVEVEDVEGGSNNRLFIILAVGLAGLIVLGLIAIGGVLYIRNIGSAQNQAQIDLNTPTVDIVQVVQTATPTPSSTPTHTPMPPVSTDTPTPTTTNTPVVLASNTPSSQTGGSTEANQTPAPQQAATNTPVPIGTPVGNNNSAAEVPNTGVGGFGLGLIGLGLVAVLFISRRLRHVT